MTKTNKKVFLRKKEWGWNFNRRVWVDENGTEYVKMRGWTELEWVLARADSYQVVRDN